MTVNIDWDSLGFQLTPAKIMYIATVTPGRPWGAGEFVPYGPFSLSPAAGVLNYGQGLIEGIKASRTQDGRICLFRPDQNALRFALGAERLAMPPLPPDRFVEIMVEMVRRNQEYVPPVGLGSLYIRPCLWGTGPILGMGAAPEYTFSVYASPVGHYFKKGGIVPVKFEVCETFHRSAAKGMGGTKYIGNYAPTILPTAEAKQRGFSGHIYLDAVHETYIEEAGIANFFCVKGNCLMTPQLSDSILPGVIRASVIELAKKILGMEVVEARLAIETALTADECFCTGTAAVVTPIASITYQQKETVYQAFQTGPRTQQIYQLLTKIQQGILEDRFQWLVDTERHYAYSM